MAEPRNESRTDIERHQRTEREKGGESISRRQPSGPGRRDPFSMMNDLHRQMEQLFGNFGFGSLFPRAIEPGAWAPQIETYERDGKLVVCADLPGLKKEDVKINLQDNILTIEGERKNERSDEKGGWSERSYGTFYRSLALPEGINPDNANATFKDGVLEITLDAPRAQQPHGRSIEIR